MHYLYTNNVLKMDETKVKTVKIIVEIIQTKLSSKIVATHQHISVLCQFYKKWLYKDQTIQFCKSLMNSTGEVISVFK